MALKKEGRADGQSQKKKKIMEIQSKGRRSTSQRRKEMGTGDLATFPSARTREFSVVWRVRLRSADRSTIWPRWPLIFFHPKRFGLNYWMLDHRISRLFFTHSSPFPFKSIFKWATDSSTRLSSWYPKKVKSYFIFLTFYFLIQLDH